MSFPDPVIDVFCRSTESKADQEKTVRSGPCSGAAGSLGFSRYEMREVEYSPSFPRPEPDFEIRPGDASMEGQWAS